MGRFYRLLFENIMLLYAGASVRYLYQKYIRKKNMGFNDVLRGISAPTTKIDERYNVENEFANRAYGCGFMCIIIIVIVIISRIL